MSFFKVVDVDVDDDDDDDDDDDNRKEKTSSATAPKKQTNKQTKIDWWCFTQTKNK